MTIAVSCRIAGRAISVIDCIIKQWDERCHCPEAKLAIDEKPMGLPGRILLPVLQQRELKFSTKSESDQFTGPAVAARNNDVPQVAKKPLPSVVKAPIEQVQEEKEDYFTRSKGGRKISCPKCGEKTMIQSLRHHVDYLDGAKGVCRACQTILGIAGLVPRHRRVRDLPSEEVPEEVIDEVPDKLPNPKDLHLDYLVSCVEEAKRRLDLLDTALTP